MRCDFLDKGKDPNDISDIELLKSGLKKTITVRNAMGGELYWSILQDQVLAIRNRLVCLNVSYKEIDDYLKEK